MTQRTASCSCGQLTATVIGEPIRVSICHCLACQRRTGSVFSAQARFRSDVVEVQGQSSQHALVGDEGGKATFHFCPNCAATVYYTYDGQAGNTIIPVGAFADPDFPAPTFSVYEDRKHDWVGLLLDMEHIA